MVGSDDAFPIEMVPFLGDMLIFRGVYNIAKNIIHPWRIHGTDIFACIHLTTKNGINKPMAHASIVRK